MGTFKTKSTLYYNPSLIPVIAERIADEFSSDGYEINREDIPTGGIDVSVSKGTLFKTILGMQTALKITLIPLGNGISFEAGAGVFGQRVIPAVIMWFYAWPLLLTQLWGMIQQTKLDDKALAIAEKVVMENTPVPSAPSFANPPAPNVIENVVENIDAVKFCTNCGNKLPTDAKFCSRCGHQL